MTTHLQVEEEEEEEKLDSSPIQHHPMSSAGSVEACASACVGVALVYDEEVMAVNGNEDEDGYSHMAMIVVLEMVQHC